MTAYSFKKLFVAPIRAGLGLLPGIPKIREGGSFGPNGQDVVEYIPDPNPPCPKLQTIRAVGKRRHVRPGEIIQLYCGMRTQHCFKIGDARCTAVRDIVITFGKLSGVSVGNSKEPQAYFQGGGLDDFAHRDGFGSWSEMVRFWEKEHGLDVFIGKLIEWEPIR